MAFILFAKNKIISALFVSIKIVKSFNGVEISFRQRLS